MGNPRRRSYCTSIVRLGEAFLQAASPSHGHLTCVSRVPAVFVYTYYPFSWSIIFAVPTKFITRPKSSLTAYKNWDTELNCDIFGYPYPEIRWARSLKKLPVNRHVINGSKLTIKNTTEKDGGAYVCQAANELGNEFAVTWVVVKVAGKPRIKKNENYYKWRRGCDEYSYCCSFIFFIFFFKWIHTWCQALPVKFKWRMLVILWS